MLKLHSTTRLILTILVLMSAGISAQEAKAITWGISGPGTTNVTYEQDGAVTFTYELDVRNTYGVFTWDISGGFFKPGPLSYDWTYAGTHNYQQSHTQFGVDSETQLPSRLPNAPRSPHFSYSGNISGTVMNYSKLHLWVSGASDDRTDFLRGTLTLRAVPIPPSMLLLGTAFVVLGGFASRRRKVRMSR